MVTIYGANSVSGYDVANSLRLNSGDSAQMNKTLGTATDVDKYTISMWVKRSRISHRQMMMRVINPSSTSTYAFLEFQSDDKIGTNDYDGSGSIAKVTNRVFRDTSAWYHIVLALDSTQSTASDRSKLYINGVLETSFSTDSGGSQNQNLMGNTSGKNIYIGGDGGQNARYCGLYISQAVFVDGTQLAPTSFGETDSNGVWIPKAISGLTFGNNGFNLDFADATDLGDDESGNGNDFTENNIASIDKSLDTPLNNYATLNPLNPIVHDFEEGNLRIDATTTNWDSAFSTIGASSGKWYFEMKFLTLHGGLRRAAMGLVDARDQTLMATNEVGYNITGTVGDSVGYNGNGTSNTVKKNDSGVYNGTEWSVNDIICMAADLDNGAVYFRVNGGAWLNSGDPTSGSSKTGAVTITTGETYVFGGTAYGADTEWQFNFGAPSFAISSSNSDANGHGSFEYAVPSGYFALNTKNLAEHG